MILILSIEQDLSTHNVIDWLDFYRTKWEVIYFENFISVNSDILNLEKLFKSASVIWFRKWGSSSLLSHTQQIVLNYLYYCGKNAYWINSDKDKNINKIIQLDIAKSVGLKIPQTYILNTKEKLKEILIQKSSIIAKALVPQDLIIENDECYVNYTDRISIEEIDLIDDNFDYTIFQEEIEKEFEIRTFYLDGEFYSMAIFSQSDSQTQIDFRKYNIKKPNRTIPFKLPIDIKTKLLKFIKLSNINSGSIDLIKATNGNFYFLEINPYGQYGMTSTPCNYNLDKIIADILILKNNKNEKM